MYEVLNLPGFLQSKEADYKKHSEFIRKFSERLHYELGALLQYVSIYSYILSIMFQLKIMGANKND
ncbi:hypothetical protein F1737_08995 [Methanoplanus sp. FWC-SCC4]|uniref:Uncharacterized protein n=1 Tax=Methanochimaera problematica TaxID=2609417 RepID=A0AA97I4W9_9EURY|nr:hypothetical protein [Methanoplanus sp. FWC-SCC4]WOF16816.1 hypothetical protein F1737_08995 [Methanoplanus sp. FWC-SCC4]